MFQLYLYIFILHVLVLHICNKKCHSIRAMPQLAKEEILFLGFPFNMPVYIYIVHVEPGLHKSLYPTIRDMST